MSNKQIAVSILIVGHMYSGRRYLRDRLTSRKQKKHLAMSCSPSFEKPIVIKKQIDQKQYKFSFNVQKQEKMQDLLQRVTDTDVVLLTYDMQENQMMDFYTNLIKRIKAAVPHKNVALVGNNYQSFTFTSRRVSLIMEQVLTREVVQAILAAGWKHFEVSQEEKDEGLKNIWDFIISVAKAKRETGTLNFKNQSVSNKGEQDKGCSIF